MGHLLLDFPMVAACFGCPILQETKNHFFVVALSVLQHSRILRVQNLALSIQYHQYREAESTRILKPLSYLATLLVFEGSVVDMNVDIVVLKHLEDFIVLRDKISKLQAPWAPVSAYLSEHVPLRLFGCLDGRINLFDRVDRFVVNLLELSRKGGGQKSHHQNCQKSSHRAFLIWFSQRKK